MNVKASHMLSWICYLLLHNQYSEKHKINVLEKNNFKVSHKNIFDMSLVSMCTYVFMLHVYEHAFVETHVHPFAHMCMWKPEVDITWWLPQLFSTIFIEAEFQGSVQPT